MTEEEKKVRYTNIVYRMYVINNKIVSLNNNINNLKSKILSNVAVNDKAISDDILNNINATLDSASSSISGYIVPSLNNKIY